MRGAQIADDLARRLSDFGRQLIWLVGPVFVPSLRSRRHFLDGHKLKQEGDHDRAAAAYALGLKHKPSAFDIWVQYGHTLMEAGKTDDAATAFDRALELRSDDANLHGQIARLNRLGGDLNKAAWHEFRAAELRLAMAESITASQVIGPEALDVLLRLVPERGHADLRTLHSQGAALKPLLLRAYQLSGDASGVA